MSFEMSARCKRVDYTGAKRAVLMEYADHANDDGICWPSRSRLMYNTGLSESAVKQHTRELRESGVIEIVDHHEGGRGRIPIYRVHPEKGPQKTPFKEWLKGSTDDLKGSNGGRKRGQPVPPESLVRNHQEPSGSTEGGASASETPIESLAHHHMKRIYQAMKDEGFTITKADYGKLVARIQWMLDNMDPSDDELEDLPPAYVKAYKIRGPANDAVYALNELRRSKAREEVLEEPARMSTARRKEGYEWLFDEKDEREANRDLDAELKAMRESA